MTYRTASLPSSGGFLAELHAGRLRWDLISPFPEQPAEDRAHGDAAVDELMNFLREAIDPNGVDTSGRLPEGFHEQCAARGYFRLQGACTDGGLGLSAYNAFRMVQAASTWSVAAALSIGLHHGLGAGAYLPVLSEGDLKSELVRLLHAGAISGDADTEPNGAFNRTRVTSAVPTEDGSGYLISGEKIFIQNGPIARLLRVSATVREDEKDHIRLFFVDTEDSGFSVTSWHEFIGMKGLANAALKFDQVFVPNSRVFRLPGQPQGEWRDMPVLHNITVRGKMYTVAAVALAISRLCLHWSRQFVRRRSVNGSDLEQYEEIQRIVATNAAEVFAIESVVDWCFLAEQQHPGVDTDAEQTVAKNITSLTCWRIVDRTLSLLAAEGVETAQSKARRGAPPLPAERLFRDARILRVTGAVDFVLDHWAARRLLTQHYEKPQPAVIAVTDVHGQADSLSEQNRAHLQYVADQSLEFHRMCCELVELHPDPEALFAKENTLIQLGRISSEMFSMSAVLANAARRHPSGDGAAQDLAEIFCTEARHRIAEARRRLLGADAPHYDKISSEWLHGDRLDFLLRDTITDTPPVNL